MDPVIVSIVLAIAGWLVNATIGRNVGEAWEKYVKRIRLQKETAELLEELKTIKLPLTVAESMQLDKETLSQYLKDVKEVIYEAKELLDELDYFRLKEEVKNRSIRIKGRPSFSMSGDREELKLNKRTMSRRIKGLIKKLKQTKISLGANITLPLLGSIVCSIRASSNQRVSISRPKTTSLGNLETFYGRENEKKLILNAMKDAEQHPHKLPVIAIVGNGGVGKTALVRQVYNSTTFSKKMWICVSTNFDDEGLTCQMLKCCSVDVASSSSLNLNALKEELADKLKGEKVLLVLDDIWEIKNLNEWDSLLEPLYGTMRGSMVLVTTREPKIAHFVKTVDPYISLDGLDESSFSSLLKTIVFDDPEKRLLSGLKDIWKEIVEKLKGYPLAAKTVGRLLKDNIDAGHWEKNILKSEAWKFQKDATDIIPALRVSYDHLATHLQPCFSYCSLFPKDYEFVAEELVYMWMAQDFIHMNEDNKNKRLEDIGFDHLNELVERAFFQEIVEHWGDKVYVVHDLMHDLAQTVHQDVVATTENCLQSRSLCSLVMLNNKDTDLKDTLNWDQANGVPLRPRLLIVPSMCATSKGFSHFIHLRYLRLIGSEVFCDDPYENNRFPVQICKLYHLQVLVLDDFSENYNGLLPKEFSNLVNLRHFIAHEQFHSKIAGVGMLKNLQELKEFIVRDRTFHRSTCGAHEEDFELDQLSQMNELRGSLEIYNLQEVKSKEEAQHAYLSEKKIVNLKLSWFEYSEPRQHKYDITGRSLDIYAQIQLEYETLHYTRKKEKRRFMDRIENRRSKTDEEILEALKPTNDNLKNLCIENYGGHKSPSWLTNHSIKYLETIQLFNCRVWIDLPNFGELKFLKVLQLSHLLSVRTLTCGPHIVFPSLKVLHLDDMIELREFSSLNQVSVHEERTKWFPELKDIKITSCPKLGQVCRIFEYPCSITEASIDESVGFGSIYYSKYKGSLKIIGVKVSEDLDYIFKNFKNIYSLKIEKNEDGMIFYSGESLREIEIYDCSVSGEEFSNLLSHLPATRVLSIKGCQKVDSISFSSIIDKPNIASSEAVVEVDRKQSPHPLVCVEELYIDDCPNMVLGEGGLSRISALKILGVVGSQHVLDSMNQKEVHVQTLIVSYSRIVSLKLNNFIKLSKLKLYSCENLAAVEGPNLPALLEASIERCPHLMFLMPIKRLETDNIESLSTLNSVSTSVQSLTLTSMWTEKQENALKHFTALEDLTFLETKFPGSLRSLLDLLNPHPSLKKLTFASCKYQDSWIRRDMLDLNNYEFSNESDDDMGVYFFVKKDFESIDTTELRAIEARKGQFLWLS